MNLSNPGPNRFRLWSLVGCALFAVQIAFPDTGLSQGALLGLRGRVSNARVSFYLEKELNPIAIIHADAIRTDYQRKGYFRIGVLPMVVLEGLNLELCDPSRLPAAFTNVNSHFKVKRNVADAVECRDFSLSFSNLAGPVLRAKRVRIERDSEWRLDEGMVSQPNDRPVAFRRATLRVAGPETGLLICETTNGVVRTHLLSLAPNPEMQPAQP